MRYPKKKAADKTQFAQTAAGPAEMKADATESADVLSKASADSVQDGEPDVAPEAPASEDPSNAEVKADAEMVEITVRSFAWIGNLKPGTVFHVSEADFIALQKQGAVERV